MSDSGTVGKRDPSRSYQYLLRALGAYLDEEAPDRFSIVEGPDQYTILLEWNTNDLRLTRMTLEELEVQNSYLMEGRTRAGKVQRRPDPSGSGDGAAPPPEPLKKWQHAPSSRQDVFRALGFELDDDEAYYILLDEIDEGLLVTYSYLDPTEGYSWRKRLVILRYEEMKEILDAAYSRRRPEERKPWFRRIMSGDAV